jgi:hypothetical protein
MEGTLMRFDVDITIAGLGADAGERLFDVLADALPDMDPVATHDTWTNTFTVSVSPDVPTAHDAVQTAVARFRAATAEFDDADLSRIRADVPQAA